MVRDSLNARNARDSFTLLDAKRASRFARRVHAPKDFHGAVGLSDSCLVLMIGPLVAGS